MVCISLVCIFLPGILIAERTHVHAQREAMGAGLETDISEESSLDISPQTWSESLWLVTIVMTTVGFGDFAPVSFVGRFFTLAAALVGILLSALMISIVQNQLTLSYQQGYAVKCLTRDRLQEKLEKCAATLIKTHWQMHLQARRISKMQQARADERHSQGDLTSWARERAMAWCKRARADAHPLPDARVAAAVSPYLAISRPISRTLEETASVLKRVRRISRERAGEAGRDLARWSERGSVRAESSSVGEKGGRLVSFPDEGQAGDSVPPAPPSLLSPPSPPQHMRVAAAVDDDDSCDDVDAVVGADPSADYDDDDDNDAVVAGAQVTPRTVAATHDLEGDAEDSTVQGAARGAQGGTRAGEAEGTRTSAVEVPEEVPEEVTPAPAVARRRATVSVEGEDSPTSRHGTGSSRDSARRRTSSLAHRCFSSVAVARRRSNAMRPQGHSASVKGRASAAASADALRRSSRAFTRPSTSISSSSSGSPEIGTSPTRTSQLSLHTPFA